MSTRNLLVICPDRRMLGDLIPQLRRELPGSPLAEHGYYPDRANLIDSLGSGTAPLCFLDLSSSPQIGMELLENILSISPESQVVALLATNDSELVLSSLRRGASEFLLHPITGDQLQPVLGRVAQARGRNPASPGGAGKVIAVCPVKGACGASTLACNLAYQWAKHGKTKVLLADFDPVTGIQFFLLKLKSSYSFLDALARSGSLDADLWKGLVCSAGSFDVLLAPENPIESAHDLADPRPVLQFASQIYEVVIVDLGGPFTAWSLAVIASSDIVLLVSTNELPSLRATQRVLQHLDRHQVDRSKLRLTINRYSPGVGLTEEAIETALHTGIYASLPSDYETIQRAQVDGKPAAQSSAYARGVLSLAERLAGKRPDTPNHNSKASTWKSLFGSLLSRAT